MVKKIERERALRKVACAYAVGKARRVIRGAGYIEAHIEHDDTMTVIVSYHGREYATVQRVH